MDALTELRTLIDRHGDADKRETALPNVALFRSETTTTPMPGCYRPLACFVAQGSKRVMLGDRVFQYDPAKYLVVTVDLPAIAGISEASPEKPYLAAALALDPATLAALLLELPAAERERQDAPAAGLRVSPMTPDLLDPVARLIRLLDHPEDIPVLAPLAEREILYKLLRGEQGAMLRQIALADSRLSQINRAIEWIKHNYARPLRVDTLAEVANMSPSSFHRHFKAVTELSPLQFQKQIRLQEARRLLLAENANAQSIGFAVGYESPSQFSREYSRLFGAPPGRDVAQLRTLSTPDRMPFAEAMGA
jgi:AraC-like DNA-binding protein